MKTTIIKRLGYLITAVSLFTSTAFAEQLTVLVKNSTSDPVVSANNLPISVTQIKFPNGQKLGTNMTDFAPYAILSQTDGSPSGEIELIKNDGLHMCKIYVLYDTAHKKYTTISEGFGNYSCSVGDVDSNKTIRVVIAKG